MKFGYSIPQIEKTLPIRSHNIEDLFKFLNYRVCLCLSY
jgi:hypothetical protein